MGLSIGLLVGVALATAVAWLVNHLAPGVFASLVRRPAVLVHVELDSANIYAGMPNWVGSSWVLPPDVNADILGKAPTSICRDWRSWMWPKGAMNGDCTEMQITLQGAAESTVLVDGLRVTMVERSEPVGNCFICPVGGASQNPRSIFVDLDWEPGVVSYREDGDEPSEQFVFTLSKGEVEVFHVQAWTKHYRVVWTAELLLIVDGKRRTIRLNDNGRPFRTCATEGLPTWAWGSSEWKGPQPTATDQD